MKKYFYMFFAAYCVFCTNLNTAKAESGAWESTKEVTSDAWEGTKNVVGDVWDGTKKVTSDVWDGTKNVASDVKDGVTGDTNTQVAPSDNQTLHHTDKTPDNFSDNK